MFLIVLSVPAPKITKQWSSLQQKKKKRLKSEGERLRSMHTWGKNGASRKSPQECSDADRSLSSPQKPWTTFSHGNHSLLSLNQVVSFFRVSVLTFPLLPFTMDDHLPCKIMLQINCHHTYMEPLNSFMRLFPLLFCKCPKNESDFFY